MRGRDAAKEGRGWEQEELSTQGFGGHHHDGGVVGLKTQPKVVGQTCGLGILVVLDVDEFV
jgi:hypothetical protein